VLIFGKEIIEKLLLGSGLLLLLGTLRSQDFSKTTSGILLQSINVFI
jgi:hypothetical protein